MITGILQLALLVHDYDAAKAFYCGLLGFSLIEDTELPTKRWIRLRAAGGGGSELVLVKAKEEDEIKLVGKQAGSRVLLFCLSDNLEQDYESLKESGVSFLQPPTLRPHGKVAVLEDLYGNRIDLIELLA